MFGLCALKRLLTRGREDLVMYLIGAYGIWTVVIAWHLPRRHIGHALWNSSGHGWAAVLLRWSTKTMLTTVTRKAWGHSASSLIALLVSVVIIRRISHRSVESTAVSSTPA